MLRLHKITTDRDSFTMLAFQADASLSAGCALTDFQSPPNKYSTYLYMSFDAPVNIAEHNPQCWATEQQLCFMQIFIEGVRVGTDPRQRFVPSASLYVNMFAQKSKCRTSLR